MNGKSLGFSPLTIYYYIEGAFFFKKKIWTILYKGSLITSWMEDQYKAHF